MENQDDFKIVESGKKLPLIALRGMVLFPHASIPVTEISDSNVLKDMRAGQRLIIATSFANKNQEPESQVASYGTEALLVGSIKLGEGQEGVVIKGVRRVRIKKSAGRQAVFDVLGDLEFERTAKFEARFRAMRMFVRKLTQLNPTVSNDTEYLLNAVDEPHVLMDLVAPFLSIDIKTKLEFLATPSIGERLEKITEYLGSEIELLKMANKIHERARRDLKDAQKRTYLMEQIRNLKAELGDIEGISSELDDFDERLDGLELPGQVRKACDRELERMEMMPPGSPEYMVSHNYLTWLTELPWPREDEPGSRPDILQAEKQLNKDHYGLEKVKEKILEYLAVMQHQEKDRGEILLLVGPPGVGKTSLAQSIAKAMDRPFARISLGGLKDEAEIRGHRRTYIGSMPGKIIHAIKQTESSAPVILLDEIDKIGFEPGRGDLGSALLEVLDPEQNKHFTDHFLNVPFDLSKVLFIATANTTATIMSPLLDRMEAVELRSYTEPEKVAIATKHLIPRIRKDLNLQASQYSCRKTVLERIIRDYTREAGVRQLKRELTSVGRKLVRSLVSSEDLQKVNPENLPGFLGQPKFLSEPKDAELIPGVAVGLAYTSVGGDIMYVETSKSYVGEGKGKLVLTGSLGKVMRESAQTVLSYLSAVSEGEDHPFDFSAKEIDASAIHLHFPDGATPKDGPSAGTAILCALTSLMSGRAIPGVLAMTGEITLRGQVLPVGGIREKVLAAHRYGKTTVILPVQNMKDLEELPRDVRDKMRFIPVATMREVLEITGLIDAVDTKAKDRLYTKPVKFGFPLQQWQ